MAEVKRGALLSSDENNPLDFHFITPDSFLICFKEKKEIHQLLLLLSAIKKFYFLNFSHLIFRLYYTYYTY